MKGIIVVDIPDDCRLCPAYDSEVNYCSCVDKKILEVKKPDWCPIKPMPEKKNAPKKVCSIPGVHYVGWANGWNCCVEEILKGESNEKE